MSDTREIVDQYVDFTRFLVTSMIPGVREDAVEISGSAGRDTLFLSVKVPDSCRGRIIGRAGQNVRAVRALLEARDPSLPYQVKLDIVR